MKKIFFQIIILFLLTTISHSQYKSDFRVNDDNGSAYQNATKIDVDKDGNFIVVWQDQRNNAGIGSRYDIYCQRFNYNGLALGNNFKINQYDSTSSFPNVVFKKDGGFIVIWREGVWVGLYIDSIRYYIKLYNKFGNPVSNRIVVSDSQYYCTYGDFPSIKINKNLEIFVVMTLQEGGFGAANIFLQKLDSLGNKIGNNVKANDDTSLYFEQRHPNITVQKDNSFIIVWDDNRLSYIPDIFMQKYNSIGQKIGINQRVNDDPINPNVGHWSPSISSDTSGRFSIAWTDSRESGGSFEDIYCQLFDSAGNFVGSNFRVNGGFEWDRGNAQIKKRNDGYFIIGWGDSYANGSANCPYFQRFSNLNNFIGTNHWVTNYNPSQAKAFSDITLWNDRIISVWGDYRNGNSDIYCNIRSFQNPDSIINNITVNNSNKKYNFGLYQNYPNPFNNSTVISFKINEKSFVKIILFDILGREVATFINKMLYAGDYYLNLSMNKYNLSSGIYFYKLISGNNSSDIKKFIIIK